MRLLLLDDPDEARELWADMQQAVGCTDLWPGDDHTYWRLVPDSMEGALGLCSAVYRPDKGYAYLSYAVVHPIVQSAGLQRRMIRHRLRWAERQGAIFATTYTFLHNYPSIANLLKCGFRFAEKPLGWTGVAGDVHYFERQL